MKKSLILGVLLFGISGKVYGLTCEQCVPESCANYNLGTALDCVSYCQEKIHTGHHAKEVVEKCQARVDLLMKQEQKAQVFPHACGNSKKTVPLENLTRLEGVIESRNHTQYSFVMVDGSGHQGGREMSIIPDVGEIGTGRGNGEVVLLSRTPQGHRVLADVNLDENKVYCLTPSYLLE